VKAGAQFFADAYSIYHFTEADYDHRTVNHGAGAYARRDPDGTCVHCHTMEGMWSGLRHFLDHFKGISQRFLHLRVARSDRSSSLIWTQISLLSSNKSTICRDPRGAMLLSTLPPVWEGHLQGLENPGLLRIGAGQARHAVGII
jgi:hypothetical protein